MKVAITTWGYLHGSSSCETVILSPAHPDFADTDPLDIREADWAEQMYFASGQETTLTWHDWDRQEDTQVGWASRLCKAMGTDKDDLDGDFYEFDQMIGTMGAVYGQVVRCSGRVK